MTIAHRSPRRDRWSTDRCTRRDRRVDQTGSAILCSRRCRRPHL